jgi:hypothetical protein
VSRGTALASLLLLVSACSRAAKDAEPAAATPAGEAALVAAPAPSNPPDAALPAPVLPPLPPPPSSREHCLAPPAVPDLTLVPRLAELGRASCDGNPRLQVLYRPGSRALSLAELDQLVVQLTPALKEQLGVEYVATSSCCHGKKQKQERCLSVRLPVCSHPLERVAQVFSEQLSATQISGAKVNLLVEYTGHVGPRCSPADASCRPVPYLSVPPTPGDKAAGRATPPYDPALGREPVVYWKEPLSSGACAHDGECTRFGCGNHCMPWHTPEFAASCPGFIYLHDAHCGCVGGQCTWFTQVPEAHFRVTPGTPRVSSPGLSPERLQKTVSLGWLARQFRTCYEKHLDRLPLDVVLEFQVDGAGRLHSVVVDTPDPARAACLVRAVKQLRASGSELRPRGSPGGFLAPHVAPRQARAAPVIACRSRPGGRCLP